MRWIVLAGAGGAIGALARWGIAEVMPRPDSGFPWATLAVNVVGCLLIGFGARRIDPASELWRFAVTGVLGGFTTFSSFAVEIRVLLADDRAATALWYVAATLVAGLVAVELGRAVGGHAGGHHPAGGHAAGDGST